MVEVFLSFLCFFGSVGSGHLRGHIKIHMLCGICAHLASTAPTYNLVKAANLDRDERGNDEENLTDMV